VVASRSIIKQHGKSSSAWICIFIWNRGNSPKHTTATCYYSTRHIFCSTLFNHWKALFSLLTKWSAKCAEGIEYVYSIPSLIWMNFCSYRLVCVWSGNFRNVPRFFLASVLFVVFAQGLDSGLALPSAVPFYASPRTFAAGRRRQAFTFGICMSCMNFLQCHSEWARSPDSPFSPPKALLCLFISAEIWASYKIYACGFYELIPLPDSVVFYGSLRPWRTGEKTPNN